MKKILALTLALMMLTMCFVACNNETPDNGDDTTPAGDVADTTPAGEETTPAPELAYKNALLCSDIPENTSVAEDKAIYFKKGDVEDLADKLKLLCDNNELVEKLRDGVDEFILNKYSWQDVAEATCKLYEI